ncbi:hypothetical protein [Cupriavidus necator]
MSNETPFPLQRRLFASILDTRSLIYKRSPAVTQRNANSLGVQFARDFHAYLTTSTNPDGTPIFPRFYYSAAWQKGETGRGTFTAGSVTFAATDLGPLGTAPGDPYGIYFHMGGLTSGAGSHPNILRRSIKNIPTVIDQVGQIASAVTGRGSDQEEFGTILGHYLANKQKESANLVFSVGGDSRGAMAAQFAQDAAALENVPLATFRFNSAPIPKPRDKQHLDAAWNALGGEHVREMFTMEITPHGDPVGDLHKGPAGILLRRTCRDPSKHATRFANLTADEASGYRKHTSVENIRQGLSVHGAPFYEHLARLAEGQRQDNYLQQVGRHASSEYGAPIPSSRDITGPASTATPGTSSPLTDPQSYTAPSAPTLPAGPMPSTLAGNNVTLSSVSPANTMPALPTASSPIAAIHQAAIRVPQ